MDKEELSKYLAKLGAKGGKASAAALSKKQRIERARKAGKAPKAKKAGGHEHESAARLCLESWRFLVDPLPRYAG